MEPGIISTLISIAGTVISAVVSWNVAKVTANKETSKMLMTWEHEKMVSSEKEFSEMVDAVTRYMQVHSDENRMIALARINTVRASIAETEKLTCKLELLYKSANLLREDGQPNFQFVDECLTEVLDEKRKTNRRTQAQH